MQRNSLTHLTENGGTGESGLGAKRVQFSEIQAAVQRYWEETEP